MRSSIASRPPLRAWGRAEVPAVVESQADRQLHGRRIAARLGAVAPHLRPLARPASQARRGRRGGRRPPGPPAAARPVRHRRPRPGSDPAAASARTRAGGTGSSGRRRRGRGRRRAARRSRAARRPGPRGGRRACRGPRTPPASTRRRRRGWRDRRRRRRGSTQSLAVCTGGPVAEDEHRRPEAAPAPCSPPRTARSRWHRAGASRDRGRAIPPSPCTGRGSRCARARRCGRWPTRNGSRARRPVPGEAPQALARDERAEVRQVHTELHDGLPGSLIGWGAGRYLRARAPCCSLVPAYDRPEETRRLPWPRSTSIPKEWRSRGPTATSSSAPGRGSSPWPVRWRSTPTARLVGQGRLRGAGAAGLPQRRSRLGRGRRRLRRRHQDDGLHRRLRRGHALQAPHRGAAPR